MTVRIGDPLTFEDVAAVANGAPVDIAPDVPDRMEPARRIVREAVDSGRAVYGITTGIGDLSTVRIEPTQAEQLQRDIVRSHSTGVGPELPAKVVRAMLLLRARTFAFGVSGVRFEVVDRLVAMLNRGIHPIVPSQGSLGCSGDLAPLAHLALPLIGEGTVEHNGQPVPALTALQAERIEPLRLTHKEGLALVNGTEQMLAMGILACLGAEQLARAADVTGAMAVEAGLGTDHAFDSGLIALRKHPSAVQVAKNLCRLLEKSAIVASHRDSEHLVQDAYSLRCIPQVHGAYRDGIAYVRRTLESELASAIDNPTVMVDTGEVLSGGNFHGESLGLALDHLCLCITGFGTIAERRVARLVDPDLNNGLPPFLTTDPGRRSGFMLVQYTAAALVNDSRGLCFPSSVDSIPSSAGQEDHVSMGATSARRATAILANSQNIIAIEALCAAQGLDLRSLEPAPATKAARDAIRARSPRLEEDRPLAPDIASVQEAIANQELTHAAEQRTGPLA